MSVSRPQVKVQEISYPAAIAADATGRLAYVVQAEKGIANEYLYIESEDDLVNTIGEPTSDTTKDFHVCKAFLNYGNDLVIVRTVDPDTAQLPRRALIGGNQSETGYDGDAINETGDEVYFTDYESHSVKSGNHLEFYSKSAFDSGSSGLQVLEVAISKPTSGQIWANNTDIIQDTTLFANEFTYGPDYSNQEIAIAVIVDGTIVEKHIVSLTDGAKNAQNQNIYIRDYLDANSDYIWGFEGTGAWAAIHSNEAFELTNGTKGSTPSSGDYETSYAKFRNKNDITFDYIIDGTHSSNRSYIISSIVEYRKDCVAFIGPQESDLIASDIPISNTDTIVSNIVDDRNDMTASTWVCYCGNYKKVYDKYQDKNIWIPFTGDIAGIKVKVNTESEIWTPAAGTIWGIIANTVELAFNPSKTQQDKLYRNQINHIYQKVGKGVVVDGQRTLTTQNIGVSRLNIRDLFRFIEINVAEAAEDFLHQLNNEETRNRFVSIVQPFLEDIQTAGGIYDFRVICDETNNTSADIDNYRFNVSVIIQATKSIETITLKFYDLPVGTNIEEII